LCHRGPGSDAAQPRQIRELARYQDTAMKDAYTWGAILVIVLASSTGDVLLSRAMKQIGDVGKYSRRAGLLAVLGRVVRTPLFLFGLVTMYLAFYCFLFVFYLVEVIVVCSSSM